MGYGTGTGPFPKAESQTVNVFGCMGACVSSPIAGGGDPQVSLEPVLGGGVEICTDPKQATPDSQCDALKPGNRGVNDPNCDNKIQPPGVPMPRSIGVGYILGASVKRGGRICYRIGFFGEIPGPSLDLGSMYEK